MVRVLAQSAVDLGLTLGQIKPKFKIGICCSSSEHAALRPTLEKSLFAVAYSNVFMLGRYKKKM